MKNIITDFGIFLNEKYELIHIDEADDLSGIEAKAGIIGASKTNTTNKTAVDALKKGFDELKANGKDRPLLNIKGEVSENNALYVKNGISELKPKSEKKGDYIKFLDNILDGDKGGPIGIKVSYGTLSKSGVEASGNGIFALGRMIKALSTGMISRDTEIYLCLNMENTASFVADVKSGCQTSNPSNTILMLMIGNGIIVPNKGNTESVVIAGKNLANNKDLLSSLARRNAVPSISVVGGKKITEDLQKIEPVKSLESKVVEKYKGKKIDKDVDAAAKIYAEISNEIAAPYIETIAYKFKKFIDDSCKKSGVSGDIFADVKKGIDEKAKGMISNSNSDNTLALAKTRIKDIFSPKKEGEGTPIKGASISTVSVDGKEGKV